VCWLLKLRKAVSLVLVLWYVSINSRRLISNYSNAYKKSGLESTPKLFTEKQFAKYMEMVEEQNVPMVSLRFWQK